MAAPRTVPLTGTAMPGAELHIFDVEQAQGTVVIGPGAGCDAERYFWLAQALTGEGLACFVIEPPQMPVRTPIAPDIEKLMRLVTLSEADHALQFAANHYPGLPRFAIGHSLGGAVLLEGLDPDEAGHNPRNGGYVASTSFADLSGVVILGAQLQAEAMGIPLPTRSNDRPLAKPAATRLLFIAGERDHIAPPNQMMATASRYGENGAELVVLEGANHLFWAAGHGVHDRPDLDGKSELDPALQRAKTAQITAAHFATSLADRRTSKL
jgi:alpha-beta hydrolase superfamily lysophospholipase